MILAEVLLVLVGEDLDKARRWSNFKAFLPMAVILVEYYLKATIVSGYLI